MKAQQLLIKTHTDSHFFSCAAFMWHFCLLNENSLLRFGVWFKPKSPAFFFRSKQGEASKRNSAAFHLCFRLFSKGNLVVVKGLVLFGVFFFLFEELELQQRLNKHTATIFWKQWRKWSLEKDELTCHNCPEILLQTGCGRFSAAWSVGRKINVCRGWKNVSLQFSAMKPKKNPNNIYSIYLSLNCE